MLWELLQRGVSANDLAVTASEVLTAFILAVPVGALIGFAIAENRYFAEVAKPLLFFAFSIRNRSFLPMFILVFASASRKGRLGFFSPSSSSYVDDDGGGVRQGRASHRARSYGATPLQTAFRVYLPSMLPVLLEALRISMIFNLTGSFLPKCTPRVKASASDRDLGRELPDEAAARRRHHDRRDRHDIQRTGQIVENTMQPLANVNPAQAGRPRRLDCRPQYRQIFRTSTQDVEALSTSRSR